MSKNDLRVEWSNANQQWLIVGGNLPLGTAWAGFDTYTEALTEAHHIADDIGVEVQESAKEWPRHENHIRL